MKIILGSQSEGRKQMMEEMGIEFEIIPPNIDEKAIRFNDPKELVLAIGKAKTAALIPRISEPAILITSDQVAVYKDEIREKPESREEVKKFLESYNTHSVEVITSVVVTNLQTQKQVYEVDIATVHFNPFSESEIDEIIEDGQVFEFAGAFTLEGKYWDSHLKKIEGTRDSVIGLPKDITKRLINSVL